MKNVFIFLAILSMCMANDVAAENEKKMTRKEREAAWRAARLKKKAEAKAREAERDSIDFVQAIQALQSGSWALEATSITFNNGYTEYVTPSTNFVSINDGTAVVQTAFDNSNINSPNGLGGITLEGGITGVEMSRDKNGNIHYSYGIQGADISATVYITLNANSNTATAYVSPNFSGNNITMDGTLYPYSTAGVFEGTPGYLWSGNAGIWFAPHPSMMMPPPMIGARPPMMRPPMMRPPMMRPPMGPRPPIGGIRPPMGSGGGGGISSGPPGFVP